MRRSTEIDYRLNLGSVIVSAVFHKCCNAFERSLAVHLGISNRFELCENNVKNLIFKSNGVVYVASHRSNVPVGCDCYVMKRFAFQFNKRLSKILIQ